jgi:peptidoglycan/xylan/chitin deacetylase (PgdA/CDA1 family)
MLLFHGVTPRICDDRIELNHHARDAFYRIAKTLSLQFQVLPLEALEDVRKRPEQHARTVFLSADDGYANTLTQAAEILDELRLPWSLFVATHHIETGEPNPLFLARLFFFFAPAGSYSIRHVAKPVVLGKRRAAVAAQTIARLKGLDAVKASEAVAAIASAMPGSMLQELVSRFPSERYLRWDEVAALAKRGVEIGAHAHWHWPMNAAQSETTIAEQVEKSRALVNSRVGCCRYFAYPFGNLGDVSRTAWRKVRDAGYMAAFTTKSATLDASTNNWLLPRYVLNTREPGLAAQLRLLGLGNTRLRSWQRELGA